MDRGERPLGGREQGTKPVERLYQRRTPAPLVWGRQGRKRDGGFHGGSETTKSPRQESREGRGRKSPVATRIALVFSSLPTQRKGSHGPVKSSVRPETVKSVSEL